MDASSPHLSCAWLGLPCTNVLGLALLSDLAPPYHPTTRPCPAGIGAGLVRLSVGLTGSVAQRWRQLEEAYRHVAAVQPAAQPAYQAGHAGGEAAAGSQLKGSPTWHSFGSLDTGDSQEEGEAGASGVSRRTGPWGRPCVQGLHVAIAGWHAWHGREVASHWVAAYSLAAPHAPPCHAAGRRRLPRRAASHQGAAADQRHRVDSQQGYTAC